MPTDDDAVLAAIMRRLAQDPHGCFIVEEFRGGESFLGLIDSSWFDVTKEEAAAMRRASEVPSDSET